MTSDLFVLYMIGIAVISASVGILAAVAAPFCFRRLARSTLPVVVKKTGQGLLGLLLALVVLAIWVILFFSDWAIKILHKHGLELLNKLTGLFLVTLAVQSILNGISTFIAGLR